MVEMSVSEIRKNVSREYRITDELWEKLKLLLPPPQMHPRKGGRPRIPDRAAMDGIFFILRTGCKWSALNATDICTTSSAFRRFQEWKEAGVFLKLRDQGFDDYAQVRCIDWSWLNSKETLTSLNSSSATDLQHGKGEKIKSYRPRHKRTN